MDSYMLGCCDHVIALMPGDLEDSVYDQTQFG